LFFLFCFFFLCVCGGDLGETYWFGESLRGARLVMYFI